MFDGNLVMYIPVKGSVQIILKVQSITYKQWGVLPEGQVHWKYQDLFLHRCLYMFLSLEIFKVYCIHFYHVKLFQWQVVKIIPKQGKLIFI
jgi:hypothetical protein